MSDCRITQRGCQPASLPTECLLDGRQETVQNAVHFGRDIFGGARSLQLRSQHHCGALPNVGEDRTNVLPADRLSAVQQAAALPYRFQLNGRKLGLT
jgi:hypothetical protein